MTNEDIKQNLAIIKDMVAKARRETAESGQFFIWLGVFSLFVVVIINRLEVWGHDRYVLPVLLATLVVCGLIGYFTVNRKARKQKAESYPKTVCYSVWFACSIPVCIVMFVFPLLDVYSWNLTPVLSTLILGIAVFSTGVVFESTAIVWCSTAWWAGAVAMVFVTGSPRVFIMMGIILLGWILPGLILNRRYKNRSDVNES